MSNKSIIQLQRDRLSLIDEARSLLSKIQNEPNDAKVCELSRAHELVMRKIDVNELDIEEARSMDDNSAKRPDQSGECRGDGSPLHVEPSLWTDSKGNPIKVLERNERMAVRNDLGVGFGDYVRALVNGPRNEAEKRALSEGTASEGGYTVPTPVSGEFIDKLRAEACVIRAGARTVPMSSASLSMARVDTDPSVTWRLENAIINDSTPAFSQLLLEAKSCAGLVKVSRELLTDSININEILSNCFAQVMARELDRVALWNDGTDDGPVGVAATSGINEVSMGTNGAALTNYDKLIDTIYEMHLDNAGDPTAQIMHPRTQAALAKLKDGQNNPLTIPDMVASVPRMATTSASITETQGTANNASSILFGNFRNLFIGLRDEVQITVLRERFADYGQVGFLVWMRADVQLAHKASFSRLKGITP